jgi:hypothetical protein
MPLRAFVGRDGWLSTGPLAGQEVSKSDIRLNAGFVEMIGQTLMIQLCGRDGDAAASAQTRVQVIRTLSIKPVGATHCEYTNSVVAHPTQASMDFIAAHPISFE